MQMDLLSDIAIHGRAPMPVAAPPVGPARARRLRIMQLREQLRESGGQVDVDAVATALTRRAVFTRELAEQLSDCVCADRALAG